MNFTYHTIFPKWRSSGMKLFDKIRILRKARGLSQEQLGYSLSRVNKDGISRQTVSDWENGKFEPKLDNIRDLAEVFNVSFDALLDEAVDLEDEQVLNAVLNQLPYKNKNDQAEEEKKEPTVKRCNITFKEIVLLAFSSYGIIAGATTVNNFIRLLVAATEQNVIISLLVELGIELVFIGLFGVAFAFLLPAIFKRKTPKTSVILLLVAFSLDFAFLIYTNIWSIVQRTTDKHYPSTTYYVDSYLSTYERANASFVVYTILSFLLVGGFLAVVILIMLSYRKQKSLEKKN